MAGGFFGPRRRLLLVRNADQANRYPFTDPRAFIESVRAAWGGRLDVDVLDERAALEAELPARLPQIDCVVLLSGAVHQTSTCRALAATSELLGRWIHDGGALIALHPGETDTVEWLPEGVGATYPAVKRSCSHMAPEFSEEHQLMSLPHERSQALECRATKPYQYSYHWLEGSFVTASETVARVGGEPVLVAGELGEGRVALSPLLLDWHNYAHLFANVLAWVTRTRVLDVEGEARGLAALTGAGRLAAGVRVVAPQGRRRAGAAVEVTAPGRPSVRLAGAQRLELSASELEAWVPELLWSRLDAGHWDASFNQTIEICRHLGDAQALARFGEQLEYLRDCEDGDDGSVGSTLAALADGVVLCTGAAKEQLGIRLEPTILALESKLKETQLADILPVVPSLLVAADVSGCVTLPELVCDHARRAVVSAAADVSADSVYPVFRLRLHAAARALDQRGRLPDTAPSSALVPPALGELVASALPLPTKTVLDLLDVVALGRPRRPELALPDETWMGLVAHAWAETDRLPQLPSSLVAQHLAFWKAQPGLERRAARLVAAARSIGVLDGEAVARSPVDVRPRQRLAEAYKLLGVPAAERRLDRPVEDTLRAAPLHSTLGAALRTLGREPYRRTRAIVMPLRKAIASAGGLGIVPLVATDILQVLVVMPWAVRAPLIAACLLVTIGLAMTTDAATLGVTVGIGVGLLAWSYGVILLTVSVAQSTILSWGAHGVALLDGDVGSRRVEILPAVVTFAGLLLVVAMSVLHSQDPQP